MSGSPALGAAVAGTTATILVVVAVRVAARDVGLLEPEDALPALVSTAAVLVAGLSWRRAPTVAWLAVVLAGAVATVDLAIATRALRDDVDAATWRWLVVGIGLAAMSTAGSAVAYASEPGRRLGRWVVALGSIGVAVVAGVTAWAIAQGVPDVEADGSAIGPTGVLTRTCLVVTAVAVALGLLGDAQAPWARARRRVAAIGHPAASPDGRPRATLLARAFVEEIAPGRSRARQAALAERVRIARDLHADVVPGLRRAVALADDGGDLDALATQLRRSLADVEALGAAEHPIQLEVGGLLAALEAMAERVEATSDVVVTIDVLDDPDVLAGEPPPEVAQAALRVVRLALDNVVRHAPASHVVVAVDVGRDAVRLTVTDDGPGLGPDARAAAAGGGRRGLADMASEAAATGAALEVGRAGPGGGTRVRFGWGPPRAT